MLNTRCGMRLIIMSGAWAIGEKTWKLNPTDQGTTRMIKLSTKRHSSSTTPLILPTVCVGTSKFCGSMQSFWHITSTWPPRRPLPRLCRTSFRIKAASQKPCSEPSWSGPLTVCLPHCCPKRIALRHLRRCGAPSVIAVAATLVTPVS